MTIEKGEAISRNFFIVIVILAVFVLGFVTFNVNSNVVHIDNSNNNVKIIPAEELAGSFSSISVSAISVDSRDISETCKPQSDNEIVSKRTYNSRTFRNPDGSFTAELGAGDLFFYNGDCYVGLNTLSKPVIDKKEIKLAKIPESNLIDFGSYNISYGINVNVENYSLVLRDAKNKMLKTLPRPFSTDADGKVSLDNYVIEIKNIENNGNSNINLVNNDVNDINRLTNNKYEGVDNSGIYNYNNVLNIFVEVNKSWLNNARYPVMVDPTAQLDNTTGIYHGAVNNRPNEVLPSRWDSVNSGETIYDPNNIDFGQIAVFSNTYNARGFIEFNTSSLTSTLKISEVILNVTVASTSQVNPIETVNITRFNNTLISSNITYPKNYSGNQQLFKSIGNGTNVGGGYYLIDLTDFQTVGNKTFNLSAGGKNATGDLQNQLGSNGYFSVGITANNGSLTNQGSNRRIVLRGLSNITDYPRLFVTYTDPCTYGGSGDWTINQTCNINGQAVTVTGNLIIQDVGVFNVTGGSNITFSGSNRYIYIYRGGQIFIYTKSGFNRIN